MYKEKNDIPFIVELLRTFSIIFTLSILIMQFTALLVAYYIPEAQELSTLFALKGAGLAYSTILQFALLSLIVAIFTVFIISYRFFVTMRFLMRSFLLFITSLFSVSFFSIIFKWFPIENLKIWVIFILWFIFLYTLSAGITMLKFKLKNKKFNKLLENYKTRQNR